MKQLVHSFSSGTVDLWDVPCPGVSSGNLLIKTTRSLVSAGTERMLIEFGQAGLLDKIRQQPDKAKAVLDKALADGIIPTYFAVKTKLDTALSLGYCNVGQVISVGSKVSGYKVGDRVICNGPHSEIVSVSQHLCALIPDDIDDDSAAFTILASIGLQGIRLLSPTFGETFVVSGLGLIGLLSAQLLKSHGCNVLGIDPDPEKCCLAQKFGIKTLDLSSGLDPIEWSLSHTNSIGVDGVLIAAATESSQPVSTAAEMCRQRGRIVLVGVTGLTLSRDLFYKKELTFQVSCSYGPGRYDPAYEQHGHDYPVGFVRWTEQRNFQAVLHALSSGLLCTEPLISHRFPIDQAAAAYELLSSPESSLGILLHYPETADPGQRVIQLAAAAEAVAPSQPLLSVIGAGNYASRILIPAFAKAGARFHTLAASSGIAPVHVGRKFGFSQASTDIPFLLADPSANSVVIATRHDSHAALVKQALANGKHVFVEKPLCLTADELAAIEEVYTGQALLMVGFNRRFAPLLLDLQQHLSRLQGPKAFVYICNAGSIPADHWTQDPAEGGGRLLGEACHFVDLLRHLAASPIEELQLINATDRKLCPDTFSLQLRFSDGSIGTVHYFANGSKAFPKERLEVFADGKVFLLDNYRKLKAWGIPGFRTRRLLQQDKGQEACCASFLQAIEIGGQQPIHTSEIFEVQRWLLEAVKK